jgi:hypothetical protein
MQKGYVYFRPAPTFEEGLRRPPVLRLSQLSRQGRVFIGSLGQRPRIGFAPNHRGALKARLKAPLHRKSHANGRGMNRAFSADGLERSDVPGALPQAADEGTPLALTGTASQKRRYSPYHKHPVKTLSYSELREYDLPITAGKTGVTMRRVAGRSNHSTKGVATSPKTSVS